MRFGGEDMAALPHLSLGFASATNEAQMGDMDFRAARQKPNSVKEDDLNLYVTLFISSLCAIAAEHGVTSSVQLASRSSRTAGFITLVALALPLRIIENL